MSRAEIKNRYIRSSEVARRLGIAVKTLAKWRCRGVGPKGWIHLSATMTIYPEEAVESFLREKVESRTGFNFQKTVTIQEGLTGSSQEAGGEDRE